MNGHIGEKTLAGVFWNGLAGAVVQIVSFVIGVLLARLLLPEDFGIVAGILIFTEVANSITTSGIVAALIQRKDVGEGHYSTAFSIQIAAAAVVYALLVVISPWLGLFLRTPLTARVLPVMAISVLILPFVAMPTALLRRRMHFRAAGMTDIVQQLSAGATSLLLAVVGWGVWSLVYGRLAGYALKALHLAWLSGWRPRLRLSGHAAVDLVPFSLKVVAANMLNDVAGNISYVIIGRLLGPAQLGFYYRAYYLMTLPASRVTEILNTVFFSAFSRVHEHEGALKKMLQKAVYYVALITCPILTCLFWVAPTFVHIVYGEKWMPSVQPLQIMCLAGIALSVEPLAVSALTARGYVGWEVRRQVFYVALLLVGVSIGSYWGIVGVSSAVLLASLTVLLILQRLLARSIRLSWPDCQKVLGPSLIAAGVMSFTLASYQRLVTGFFAPHSSLMLLSSILLGVLAYGTSFVLIGLWLDNEIVNQMVGEIRSFRHRAYRLLQQP